MTAKDFRKHIESGQKVLLDGGIGTELYERGVFVNRCFEEANLSQARLVQEIHKDYWQAGAQALTTNTFGANRLKLKDHNLQDKVREINLAAVKNINEVSQGDAWIVGSIGPLGVRVEPFGLNRWSVHGLDGKTQILNFAISIIDFLKALEVEIPL